MVRLAVIGKQFVAPWEWRTDGFDYQSLADDLMTLLSDGYQLQLRSRQQCVYDPISLSTLPPNKPNYLNSGLVRSWKLCEFWPVSAEAPP